MKQKKALKRKRHEEKREPIRLKHIEARNELIEGKKKELTNMYMELMMKQFEESQRG